MTIIPSSLNSYDGDGKARKDTTAPTVKAARSSVLSPQENGSDKTADKSLRPQCLSQYIGQARLKNMLEMCIAAAKTRSEPLDHILFYGPPGLGKTTLANVVGHEMGARVH